MAGASGAMAACQIPALRTATGRPVFLSAASKAGASRSLGRRSLALDVHPGRLALCTPLRLAQRPIARSMRTSVQASLGAATVTPPASPSQEPVSTSSTDFGAKVKSAVTENPRIAGFANALVWARRAISVVRKAWKVTRLALAASTAAAGGGLSSLSLAAGMGSTLPLVSGAVASFIKMYLLLLFLRVLLTWFPNIEWDGQPWMTLRQVTDPYLNVFRNLIPPVAGQIDFTPIIGFLVLQFMVQVLEDIQIDDE